LNLFNFSLDVDLIPAQDLTMVKSDPSTGKGEQTQRHIFETALVLFREKGFDATTMQQIAERADVVKSAAYYYFPSKEAIIHAYYEDIQAAQEHMCELAFADTRDLKKRLALALKSKLDLAKNDRKLLGVVFRYTGEPRHPLSCLGRDTAELRRRAMAIFRRAIEIERLPNDLQQLLPIALWALQMGLLVMFLYDESEGQRRTLRMADNTLDLTLKLLGLAKLAVLKPVRTRALSMLREAELLPAD
jgi:AcrR family transcriptional regulator